MVKGCSIVARISTPKKKNGNGKITVLFRDGILSISILFP